MTTSTKDGNDKISNSVKDGGSSMQRRRRSRGERRNLSNISSLMSMAIFVVKVTLSCLLITTSTTIIVTPRQQEQKQEVTTTRKKNIVVHAFESYIRRTTSSKRFFCQNIHTKQQQKQSYVFSFGTTTINTRKIDQMLENHVTTTTSLSMSSNDITDDSSSSTSSSALSYPFGEETLLSDAFSKLDTTDQYDAVLTGLCAKILDTGGAGKLVLATPKEIANEVTSPLGVMEQPLKLLNEMNQRNIIASARSLSALIDTAATTENVRVMKLTLSLCMKNSSRLISEYGNLQNTLQSMPSTGSSSSSGTFMSSSETSPNGSNSSTGTSGSSFFDFVTKGNTKGQQQQQAAAVSVFDQLDPVPSDERLKEVTSATLFIGILSTCFLSKGLIPIIFDRNGDYTILTTIVPDFIIFIIGGGFVIDNFYDGMQTLLNIILSKEKRIDLPSKENLPLDIGSGKYTKTIVSGLNRMFTVDTERQCESEAAAFFTAYTLGLPCFAFQPNALEAAIMMFESMKEHKWTDNGDGTTAVTPIQTLYENTSIDPLMSSNGLLKILVWLLAPVAIEQMNHPQLIVSDPNESKGLLRRLKQKAIQLGINIEELNSMGLAVVIDSNDERGMSKMNNDDTSNMTNNDNEETLLLKWSYNEASKLLRQNKSTIKELSQQLAGGTATVGDCVATIEGW